MSDENTITMAEYIALHNLTMRATSAPENPNIDRADRWPADHWYITIQLGKDEKDKYGRSIKKAQFTTYYSTGLGHRRERLGEMRPVAPQLADVLDCLASDCASYENSRNFEDWADDLGFDSDSRSAERTYHIVGKQAKELSSFLGREAYDQLLWNVERL